MTHTTNARLAGFMLLFYIATGVVDMILFKRATNGAEGTAAKLASIAQHAPLVRLDAVVTLLTFFIAVVLAVALYALTREADRNLAVLALCCRLTEGVLNAIYAFPLLVLLWLATADPAQGSPDAATANTLGTLFLKMPGWGVIIGGTIFAVGSTLYSYLFLRARSIPVSLACGWAYSPRFCWWCFFPRSSPDSSRALTWLMWMPMLVFEVTLALWLLIKGVAVTS